MATFTVSVLKHQKRRDDKYPVSIRVTHNGKSAYIGTKMYITDKQLNKNLKIKDPFVLRELNEMITVYEEEKIKLGFKLSLYNAKELSEYLIRTTTCKTDIDMLSFAAEHISELKEKGRHGTASITQNTINSLKCFTNKEKLYFSEITINFLRKYERWLSVEKEKPVKGRGVSLYMGQIKMLFNKAINLYNDEDKGEIVITNYPFRKYKIPKEPTPEKRARPVEDIRAIINYMPTGKHDEFAKDLFLLSFCLVGMNAIDMLTCPAPVNGRLTYYRKKTTARRGDKAEISVKIEPEIEYLFAKYKGAGAYAFNFYETFTGNKQLNKVLSKGLKIISENLGISHITYYAARHSWATIAVNDCNIPLSDVHEALNHSDSAMKITEMYVIKDWSRIDRANRKVINYVFS